MPAICWPYHEQHRAILREQLLRIPEFPSDYCSGEKSFIITIKYAIICPCFEGYPLFQTNILCGRDIANEWQHMEITMPSLRWFACYDLASTYPRKQQGWDDNCIFWETWTLSLKLWARAQPNLITQKLTNLCTHESRKGGSTARTKQQSLDACVYSSYLCKCLRVCRSARTPIFSTHASVHAIMTFSVLIHLSKHFETRHSTENFSLKPRFLQLLSEAGETSEVFEANLLPKRGNAFKFWTGMVMDSLF